MVSEPDPPAVAAYQQLVDGLVLPAAVAGHPALDFCNTRAGRGSDEGREYLESFRHLVAWTRAAGLVTAAESRHLQDLGAARPESAAAVLHEARELREALARVCLGTEDEEAWSSVAGRIERAAAAASFVRADAGAPGGGSWRLIGSGLGLELPLHAISRAAGYLLETTGPRDIRCCANPGCGWLFVDRAGRRRWCSMATCGNRQKARRHAARARRASARGSYGS